MHGQNHIKRTKKLCFVAQKGEVRNGSLLEHELKGRVEDIVSVSSVRICLIKCRVIIAVNKRTDHSVTYNMCLLICKNFKT
jgi:hypothetical protein